MGAQDMKISTLVLFCQINWKLDNLANNDGNSKDIYKELKQNNTEKQKWKEGGGGGDAEDGRGEGGWGFENFIFKKRRQKPFAPQRPEGNGRGGNWTETKLKL